MIFLQIRDFVHGAQLGKLRYHAILELNASTEYSENVIL